MNTDFFYPNDSKNQKDEKKVEGRLMPSLSISKS
jgi:hypothetical protein